MRPINSGFRHNSTFESGIAETLKPLYLVVEDERE
jgi:hypothetical protein